MAGRKQTRSMHALKIIWLCATLHICLQVAQELLMSLLILVVRREKRIFTLGVGRQSNLMAFEVRSVPFVKFCE